MYGCQATFSIARVHLTTVVWFQSETIKALDEERRQEIEAARKMVLGCPICGKALQTNQVNGHDDFSLMSSVHIWILSIDYVC